ncbi:MAG: ClpXP protease specificity-enhancing factor [Betaproteobacteria bacterium]|nr:ClpXP protease specificity-enhancing factor [Betaproteobacteria bacterium]MDE2310309.1 ClpXP protease specificity-enhancing factor [Betaproteobacteria bacterium]
MSDLSTKPYLLRAIYDWCADSGLTPYLAVRVDEATRVPMAYIKDGEIVLNLSVDAVKNLHLGNDEITCGGRFGGVPHEIVVPMAAVIGIFAKETGQGLVFQGQESAPTPPGGDDGGKPPENPPPDKPRLRVVK